MDLYFGTLLMAFMIWTEALILRIRDGHAPWLDILANLHSGQTLMWLLRGLELAVFHYVSTQASLNLLDHLNSWSVWLFAFLAWDFCFYWLHRLHHKIPMLWKIHAVHHQGENYNLSLGVRNAWISSLSSIPFFVGLAWIGLPIEIFATIAGIHYFVQFYNHTALVKRSGILEYFMVTPSLHRVHHATQRIYLDRNFGGTLNIWDRIFKTRQVELRNTPPTFGVRQPVHSHNPGWLNLSPYLKGPHSFPAELGLNELRSVCIGGFLLFGLFMDYVGSQDQLSWISRLLYVGLTTIAALAWGGIADGRSWGRALWFYTIIALFFGAWNWWPGILVKIFSFALLVHGIWNFRHSVIKIS